MTFVAVDRGIHPDVCAANARELGNASEQQQAAVIIHTSAACRQERCVPANSALTSDQPSAILRQAPGLAPTRRVNTRERWLWSAKPQARAIVDSDASRFRSRALADSTRAWSSQACGASPVDLRNAREKWLTDSPQASAISRSGVAPVRSPAIISFDRLSCHGASPPLSGLETVCIPP